jgi:hypothetical protein
MLLTFLANNIMIEQQKAASPGGGSRKKPKPVYYDNHDYRADRIKKEDDELMLILSEFIRECL